MKYILPILLVITHGSHAAVMTTRICNVSSDKVSLEIDWGSRIFCGNTTLTLAPHAEKNLTTTACMPSNLIVNGKSLLTPKELNKPEITIFVDKLSNGVWLAGQTESITPCPQKSPE